MLQIAQLSARQPDVAQLTTMKKTGKIILTAPVGRDVQAAVRKAAKANGVPIRVLCAMLIEHGMDEIKTGKLSITRPEIQPAA